MERMPLGAFVKNSRSTRAYQELWQEILERLNINTNSPELNECPA